MGRRRQTRRSNTISYHCTLNSIKSIVWSSCSQLKHTLKSNPKSTRGRKERAQIYLFNRPCLQLATRLRPKPKEGARAMDYERIHKVQSGGALSPSKLRLMLLGAHHHRRRQQQQHQQQQRGKEGPNNNNPCSSSRTSPPSTMTSTEDNLLLDDAHACSIRHDEDIEDCRSDSRGGKSHKTQEIKVLKEMADQLPATRSAADEDGYSSTGGESDIVVNRCETSATSTACAFEFPRGDKSQYLPSLSLGPFFSRPIPSKWNDAEKWIVNKQTTFQPNHFRSRPVLSSTLNHLNRRPMNMTGGNWVPDSAVHEPTRTPAVEHNDSSYSHIPPPAEKSALSTASTAAAAAAAAGIIPPVLESVIMRDTGTEMTPVPSQDPSRTATPIEAVTPIRSRSSSRASTPRPGWGEEPPPPTVSAENDDDKKKLSEEEEFRVKTRREIVALGMRLGKTNIAAWASRHNDNDDAESAQDLHQMKKNKKAEFEARAQAWEEAEKSKHLARFKREEFKIQLWESNEKARVEAKWRDVEVQADRLRARAQEKMLRKVTATKQKAAAKRAAVEVLNSTSTSSKTPALSADGDDRIRRTRRMRSSSFFCCTRVS